MGSCFYDISMELSSETPVYPGDPGVEMREAYSIAKGDICNVTSLSMGSHTGTHVDAPRHFYDDGLTIDQLSPEHFIGRAKVLEIMGVSDITEADLKKFKLEKGDIVLLKTDNSKLVKEKAFNTGYASVTRDAAEYLAGVGIRTLGFDYLSVEKYGSEYPAVHYTLLGANVVIIEGLDLSGVGPGEYRLTALPLKLKGGNGSPVRAYLVSL